MTKKVRTIKSGLSKAELKARREARALLLEPNKYSDLKVEIYEFGLNYEVVLGTASEFGMCNSPDTNFRISQLVANVTQPGMFYIRDFRVANVSCTIGGSIDAYNLKDLRADFPTLTPANKVSASVYYTGLIPDHLKATPKRVLKMEEVLRGIDRALRESDIGLIKKKLKELIDRGPTFGFSICASGYASIVA